MDILSVILFFVYMSKKKAAEKVGDFSGVEKYAKRMKIWGIIALFLVIGDIVLISLLFGQDSSTYGGY